jgi:hypothetical protein
MVVGSEARDGVVGDQLRHVDWRVRPFRAKPVRRPVERAEKRARGDERIGRGERAGANAVGNQRADAAFVAIALGDDERAQALGQSVDFEMRRGTLDLVDEREDVRLGERAQPIVQRTALSSGAGERGEELVEGAVLAEVEELVLAAEVVIEIAGREIRGIRDVAHAGGRKPACAEDPGRRAENLEAPGVGAA